MVRPIHHQIPRLYLKAFCIPGTGNLWVFGRVAAFSPGSKANNNPRRMGLSLVGIRADGYMVTGQDGVPNYRYEALLQQQEHLADGALRKARNLESLVEADRRILVRYVLLSYRRLGSRDKMLESFLPTVGRIGLLRDSLLEPQLGLEEYLLRRQWRMLVAPQGQYFITNDKPVIFDERGLRCSPLLFPLSPRVMLEMGAREADDRLYRDATSDEMQRLNMLVTIRADQHVYAHEPAEWIHRGVCSCAPFKVDIP